MQSQHSRRSVRSLCCGCLAAPLAPRFLPGALLALRTLSVSHRCLQTLSPVEICCFRGLTRFRFSFWTRKSTGVILCFTCPHIRRPSVWWLKTQQLYRESGLLYLSLAFQNPSLRVTEIQVNSVLTLFLSEYVTSIDEE